MKKILITTVALALALAPMPILADTLMGCEIVKAEGGGYSIKADPTCVFTVDATAGGGPIKTRNS